MFNLFIPVFVLLGGLVLFPADLLSGKKLLGAALILGGLGFFVMQHFRQTENS